MKIETTEHETLQEHETLPLFVENQAYYDTLDYLHKVKNTVSGNITLDILDTVDELNTNTL